MTLLGELINALIVLISVMAVVLGFGSILEGACLLACKPKPVGLICGVLLIILGVALAIQGASYAIEFLRIPPPVIPSPPM